MDMIFKIQLSSFSFLFHEDSRGKHGQNNFSTFTTARKITGLGVYHLAEDVLNE